jgi:hypothetical protein
MVILTRVPMPRLKGRIAGVHLSDWGGRVHGDRLPGRGVVNFVPYLSALKDVGFNGTGSIEPGYSPEPSKIVEGVTGACRETDKLMQGTGNSSLGAIPRSRYCTGFAPFSFRTSLRMERS